MPKIKNTFHLQVMDKETDPSLIENGRTRHAENLRFGTNGGNDGIGVNINGTTIVSDLTENNDDFKCIGAEYNESENVIYYMLATTSGQISKIAEYRVQDNEDDLILHDTTGVLRLKKDGYITGINEIDGLLYWSEFGNNPRRTNIERAKTYGADGFTEDDINVIVIPPSNKLKITLQLSDSNETETNNIEEKFLAFSFRYRYLDGEYSVLAPFTEFAFQPNNFEYDFAEQSNKSMINKFNQVLIEFNTGNERVTDIQLIFKEAISNTEWIIADFNKEDLEYGNNEIKEFIFNNNKTVRTLGDSVLRNYFDNVPRTAKAQTIIDGRLLYANYTENYNLVDNEGKNIKIDYSLALSSLENTTIIEGETFPSLIAKRTLKSNRDYEVGIVYLDKYMRSSIILNSKKDTIYIPNSKSVNENKIKVTLKNKAPYWAKYFRFFVMQPKFHYEQILPTLFYEDGVYRWVKIEGSDKDKIREGDFLIVKSDSQGIVNGLVKTKVLEISTKEKNFLSAFDSENIQEREGLYFKIKPDGFRLDKADFDFYRLDTYDDSSNEHSNPIRNLAPYISQAHYYGDGGNGGINDAISGGVYSGVSNNRNRFLIQIDSEGGSPNGKDTIRWKDVEDPNWIQENVEITPNTPIILTNGVTVDFVNDIGHTTTDEWNINARNIFNTLEDDYAYAFFRVTSGVSETLGDINNEIIRTGARLKFTMEEYNLATRNWVIDVVSNGRYDNIQEWFYKENIINYLGTIGTDVNINDIRFIRGNIFPDDSANQITQDDDNGTMTLLVRGKGDQFNPFDKIAKIRATSEVLQSKDDFSILLLETEGKEQPQEVYHEIGKTYSIENGIHLADTSVAGDLNQTEDQDLLVTLDWFNAFSYGNSVESYKIKDEFNAKSLDIGIRTLSTTKEEYKEVTRKSDVTWSSIYQTEGDFNGLNTFNLSELNFITLDQEEGSIQLLDNDNGNLLVMQEDAIGIMPYNKNVIYDTEGGRVVGVANNVLDRKSYVAYAKGRYGTRHPESYVSRGSRKYVIDQVRGKLLRLSTDGITPVSDKLFEHYFSRLMAANRNSFMVAGYDPKHGEYLFSANTISEEDFVAKSSKNTFSFKEKASGFPMIYTFSPDFILEADNEVYAWKNGVMHKLNSSSEMNNFFGTQYSSKVKFFVNQEFSTEKIFTNLGIESTHPWQVKLATKLTSRDIPKECFSKIEDYWFSEIMGNTNGDAQASSSFGLGQYSINQGVILTSMKYPSLSVGDFISSSSLLFAPNRVTNITDTSIILEAEITTVSSFLMYSKNQNIDGTTIKGDVLEIEMISDENEKVELRAVNTQVVKSNYS